MPMLQFVKWFYSTMKVYGDVGGFETSATLFSSDLMYNSITVSSSLDVDLDNCGESSLNKSNPVTQIKFLQKVKYCLSLSGWQQ